jgi:hypothetical protein
LAPVPALSPPLAAVLVLVAVIAATYLPSLRRLAHLAEANPVLTPLGWYGTGILLGPGLGVVDRRLLSAALPALVLAAGWVAARAGGQLVRRSQLPDGGRVLALPDSLAGWLLPALALYAAQRFLPAGLAPAWEPPLPVLVALAAAMTLACGADRRFATVVALGALVVALLAPLPHDRSFFRRPPQIVWIGVGAAAVGLTAVLWQWIARRANAPLRGSLAGLAIGAGVGLATGVSPLVVCGLAAAALARRSPIGTTPAWEDLARSEAPAAAILWVAAGAQFGGPIGPVAGTVAVLALWPLVRRLTVRGAAEADRHLGLAVVLSYAWTTKPTDAPALVTAVAIALLLIEALAPHRQAATARLTRGLASVEVSV